MCTCQINKCYRVNNALIWINLTASVWENWSENIHHYECFFLNHIINRCVWLGWPAAVWNAYVQRTCARAGADVRTLTSTHTSCLQANPQKTRPCVCCSCRLIGVTSQNCLHCGQRPWFTAMYGFYNTRSPLITWKIYQNYSSQSTRSVFRWNWEKMWLLPCGYYLFPRRLIIMSKSAWKSKWSVMEPLCLSDGITVIIYSPFFWLSLPP